MKLASLAALSALAVTLPMAATAQTSDEAKDTREIVVTGRSVKETADVLAACIARKCPPDEDVAASLAHAENLFIGGDYANARTTLLRSIDRNRKHGTAYPVPVSSLFRANGRIAQHMGEATNFKLSVLAMRDTLKKGLGENDARTLAAQIEVGDSRANLGHPLEAQRIYKEVEKRAIELKEPRVAMFARLRNAILEQTMAEDSNFTAKKEYARTLLEDIAKNPLPGAPEFGLAARILLARADRKAGRVDTTAEIVREFAASGGTTRPLLLFNEPIKQEDIPGHTRSGGESGAASIRQDSFDVGEKWADIGFWVNADGKVSEAEVLRGNGSRNWLKPVFAHLNSRVYAPLKKDGNDGSPGLYMIERYTLTAYWTKDVTATRLRRREATPRIERLDITPEDYTPPTQTASTDAGGS